MDLNKLKTNIRKFFSNPNTLTFILVIFLIIVIYGVYSYMVKQAVAPVSVPYSTEQLKSMTEIKDESIGSVKISGNFISSNGSGLLQQSRQIRNKYVKPGYMIPENSFFYQEAIAESSIAEKTSFSDLPNDYTIYELKLNNGFHETYGCSIMTGNYIDLYFQSQDTSDQSHPKLIFEKFITSIQVLKVIDKNGLDVFTESPDEEPKPTAMWFAVPTQFFELLRIAENLPGSKIIPVPRNAAYSANPGDTEIANDAVEAFILQNASSKQ